MAASAGSGGTFFGRLSAGGFAESGRPGSTAIALKSPIHIGPKMPMSVLPSPFQSPVTG